MNTFAATGCTTCHSGPVFNGPTMPIGQGFFVKFPTYTDNKYIKKYNLMADLGRYEANKKETNKHQFRVPTLRNITDTAPYFHNGSVTTLTEAVRVMAKTQLNKTLSKNEVKDIVAFLGALTGDYPEITMPRLPATPGMTVLAQ
jgi:cytochrome c peroxidase